MWFDLESSSLLFLFVSLNAKDLIFFYRILYAFVLIESILVYTKTESERS